MAESDLRARFIDKLRHLDAFAVENSARPGTPDVNYVEGWVELKWLARWPTKPETIVSVDHFTPQQRTWLRRRRRRGGRAFVLLQVGREYLLFLGEVAADRLGHCTAAELRRLTSAYWRNGIKWKELERHLTGSLRSG